MHARTGIDGGLEEAPLVVTDSWIRGRVFGAVHVPKDPPANISRILVALQFNQEKGMLEGAPLRAMQQRLDVC